ncbi:MAG: ATP-binding cassette domain-containing protein, partial [Pseudomonadota bacterium]
VRDLTRDRGMSAILITHDLGLAATYCDDIVVMRRGEVVEAAPTQALFRDASHPYTRRLIQATPRRESTLQEIDVAPDEAAEAAIAPAIVPAAPRTAPASPRTPLLDVRNLVKTYRLREASFVDRLRATVKRATATQPAQDDRAALLHAVDDISLTIPFGGSLGVVGESGSGKSTLSSMITRLIDPTAGSILFDGVDIGAIPAARFARSPERRLIQMVFQDPTESLNPRFTAADCIADPLRRLEGLKPGKALNDRVRALAAMVGLPDHLLGRFPHQLSGGQKARVGIARGLAPQPRLLILDEPTSALDVSVQAVVLNLLDRLRSALGVGYLFVSHDLNVVRLLCDEVIVVNRGRVVERGPSQTVLDTPQDPYTRTLIDAIPHFAP